MLTEDTKTLEFNQYQEYDKAPFITYAAFKCIIEKIDGCKIHLQNTPPGFSMSTILSFRIIENKHDVYRGKDCMIKFCQFLRKHAMKIINFKKNEIVNKRAAGIIWICKNLLYL